MGEKTLKYTSKNSVTSCSAIAHKSLLCLSAESNITGLFVLQLRANSQETENKFLAKCVLPPSPEKTPSLQ